MLFTTLHYSAQHWAEDISLNIASQSCPQSTTAQLIVTVQHERLQQYAHDVLGVSMIRALKAQGKECLGMEVALGPESGARRQALGPELGVQGLVLGPVSVLPRGFVGI